MSAVAIYLKTESGDDYLFCYPSFSTEHIVERVKNRMGEELGYVWNVIVDGTQNSEGYENAIRELLLTEIEEAGMGDDE